MSRESLRNIGTVGSELTEEFLASLEATSPEEKPTFELEFPKWLTRIFSIVNWLRRRLGVHINALASVRNPKMTATYYTYRPDAGFVPVNVNVSVGDVIEFLVIHEIATHDELRKEFAKEMSEAVAEMKVKTKKGTVTLAEYLKNKGVKDPLEFIQQRIEMSITGMWKAISDVNGSKVAAYVDIKKKMVSRGDIPDTWVVQFSNAVAYDLVMMELLNSIARHMRIKTPEGRVEIRRAEELIPKWRLFRRRRRFLDHNRYREILESIVPAVTHERVHKALKAKGFDDVNELVTALHASLMKTKIPERFHKDVEKLLRILDIELHEHTLKRELEERQT